MDNNTKQKIVELYSKGYTTREVGRAVNLSPASVRYWLIKEEVSLRKTKGLKFHINKVRVPLNVIKEKEGTPEFDYFLGILATDGNIYKSNVALQFAENNKEILEHWKSFLNNLVDIKSYTRRDSGRTYYEIKFKNQEIADFYKSYGITERKTFTLKLKYINWNVLLGIFDGDGCLTMEHKTPNGYSWRFSICSASIEFINQLNDFFVSKGLHPVTYKTKNYYDISLGRREEIQILYANIYKESSYFLHRKYEKFWQPMGKLIGQPSVNSVKGMDNHKTEPSLIQEGAET